MKLIACYTVFNGLELLEKSIKSMHDHVDGVLICYQVLSNKGEQNNSVADFVSEIAGRYEKIKLHFHHPDVLLNTKENERVKHTEMMRQARAMGATHYILSACDHFYFPEQIEFAKKKAIELDFDVSLTMMKTYYKKPEWQIEPMETYQMPFISKMYPETRYQRMKYPVVVDPSVMVNTSNKIHIFNPDDVLMHHYSMIRKDIQNKFRNAAASIRWTPAMIDRFIDEYQNAKPGDSISYFGGRQLIEVENHFNI